MKQTNWVQWLSPKDSVKFHYEMIEASNNAKFTGRWDKLYILLGDWKATAEAEHDLIMKKKLTEKVPVEDYTGLDKLKE